MLFFILIILLWVGSVQGNADIHSLSEFKKGIKDDPFGRLTDSWNANNEPQSDGCPLNWYGVQCSDGRVVSITLNDMDLVGDLNFSALIGMEMLRNLSLSNNRLTGILTPELGTMKSLELLDLSRNSFSGSVPSELMTMGNLSYLNLSSNNFGGIMPSGFGNLRQLRYLDLHSNGFSGNMNFLAEFQNIIHVDLSCNKFSGSLGALSGNSSIVTSLQYLNISNNGLSGQIFATDVIPLFDSLEVFDASKNQLSGQIPSFQFVVSLRILRLGSNKFSGSMPDALFKESSMVLSELDLSSNQIQGPIGSITSTSLKNINLSANRLSGSLPLRIGSCSMVDLSNNLLHGNLSTIQSWGNYVEVIDLSSNSLTGTLPNQTSSFLRLASLKVSNNSLLGELPLVIGTYPELSDIDFSCNKLYGSLPPSLFTSFRLTYLNLSGNSFSGPIPLPSYKKAVSISTSIPLFTQNSSLLSLDLSRNSLSGNIPQGIGTLERLKFLRISENNVSGQIPQEIGMIHGLEYLDLMNNNLTGSIPNDLPDGLKGFNVSYNDLSGTVPDSLLNFPNSAFHPGNPLLVFPKGHSYAMSNGTEAHVHSLKPLIRNLMIVGFVGTASVLILLSVLVLNYCKTSSGKIKKKDIDKQTSPQNLSLGPQKTADSPPAPSSIPESNIRSSGTEPLPSEHGDILLGTAESTEPGLTRSEAKNNQLANAIISSPPGNEGKSPISLFKSSPITCDPRSSEQPSILKVCSPDKLAGDLHLFDHSFVFTPEELSRAPAEIIGRSCHGTSYKATLDSEHVVTVKWLREGISKGKKEFAREAKKLGNVRHPNLVSLRGYYWGPKEHERLIISDHINSVSLTAHLCEFEPRKLQPLSLEQRLGIAVNVARCLNYLHDERAIPHGNLKSSNVVLQLPGLNVLLTDYSLHRIMTPAGMAEQVLNAGALGYRPPEFASTSKPCPSLKSDVYAFGVILLELLTGKSAGEIVSSNPGVVDLTDWVRLLANEQRSFECFDTFIPGVDRPDGPPKLLEDMLLVALRCIRSASERPEIRTVFADLASLTT